MKANKTRSVLATFLAVIMLLAVMPVSALTSTKADDGRGVSTEYVDPDDSIRGNYSSTTLESMTERAEAIVNYRWTPSQDIATWNENAYNGLYYFPAGSTVIGEPYTLFTSEVVSWSLCSLEQYENVASSNYSATAYCNSTSATRTGPVYGSCCVDLVCEVFGGDFMNGSNPRYHNVSAIRNSQYATTITGQKMADIKAGDAVSDTTKAHIIWVGSVTDTQITIYEQTPPVARKVVLDKASCTDSNGYFVYGSKQYSVITRSNALSTFTPRLSMTASDAPAYYTSLNIFYRCGYGMISAFPITNFRIRLICKTAFGSISDFPNYHSGIFRTKKIRCSGHRLSRSYRSIKLCRFRMVFIYGFGNVSAAVIKSIADFVNVAIILNTRNKQHPFIVA